MIDKVCDVFKNVLPWRYGENHCGVSETGNVYYEAAEDFWSRHDRWVWVVDQNVQSGRFVPLIGVWREDYV